MSSKELALNIEQRYPEPADQSESVALSLDFFTEKSSYSPFSLTSDHNRIIGCIDPRDPIDVVPGEHKVVIQTAGGAAVTLNARSSDYFGNRLLSFDKLEEHVTNSVATLLGNHQECIVVANYVNNTTLAANVLLEDYNGIQVFNYDVWRTLDLADKLFPTKSRANDKDLFIMARAMTAVATLMCLTDGSQTLLIRS